MDVPRLGGSAEIESLLTEAARASGAVGAALAISHDDRLAEVTTGTAHHRTSVAVTPDTAFQIGSTTKSFTATLALQLVEAGKLELDVPVAAYLRGVPISSPDVSGEVTLRQLLGHTSGLDNGPYVDTGRGDGCVAAALDVLGSIAPIGRPGERFGYSNAAYLVVGRLIELAAGRSWDDALRRQLLEPVGLTTACTLAEQAILQRVAVGHTRTHPDAEPQVVPVWSQGRAMGPAGGTLAMSAGDLVRWGRTHLTAGRSPDGRRVLAAELVEVMQARHTDVPPNPYGTSWGLGWLRDEWGGESVIGHDGATTGGASSLRLLPDVGAVVGLVTNSPLALPRLIEAVVPALVGELFGIAVEPPAEHATPGRVWSTPPSEFVGAFARHNVDYEIQHQGEQVSLRVRTGGVTVQDVAVPTTEQEAVLHRIGDRAFRLRSEPGTPTDGAMVSFGGGGEEPVDYLYAGGMFAARRIDDRSARTGVV